MMQGDIVCIAPNPWNDLWRRRQQLMSRLARTHRVLYVEPPLSLIEAKRQGKSVKSNWRIAEGNDNLFILSPVYPLPLVRLSIMRKIGSRWAARLICKTAKRLGFGEAIFWLYNTPEAINCLDICNPYLVCYDVSDKFSAFGDLTLARSRSVEERHIRLLGKADAVLTVSRPLYEECKQHNPATYLVPNGVDYSLFSQARSESVKVPLDIARIPHPVIGYVGALYKLDFGLLDHVAERRPGWSIVLIGPPLASREIMFDNKSNLSRLKTRSNVYWLGQRKPEELPRYLKAFDIGTMCYKRVYHIPYADSSLKLLEYLAAGLPAIATGLLVRPDYATVVETAQTPEEFLQRVECLLLSDNQERIRHGMEIAKANTWDRRVTEILEILGTHMGPGGN